MSRVRRSTAALRVWGPGLDADQVTSILKATPTSTRQGLFGGRGNSWTLDSAAPEEAPLQDHIQNILERVTDNLEVWEVLADRYSVDMFCGLFLDDVNEGVELEPNVLRSLGERHILLGVDIYGAIPVSTFDPERTS